MSLYTENIVDRWYAKHGASIPRDGLVPYPDERTETSKYIIWTNSFSGGWGDGGYLRIVKYDKKQQIYKCNILTGWGASNINFISEVIDDFVDGKFTNDKFSCVISTFEQDNQVYESYQIKSVDYKYVMMASLGVSEKSFDGIS